MARRKDRRKGSVHIEDLEDRYLDFQDYLADKSNEDERRAVVDEASAKVFIDKVLPRMPGLQHYFPSNATDGDYRKIIAGSYVQDLIAGNSLNARASAEKFELSRRPGVRRRDEAVTAKVVRPATPSNVARWRRKPGRSDIEGVDTARPRRRFVKVGRRGRTYTPRRASKWVRQVVRKATKDEYFYKYRSIKTGRWIANPEKRK